MNGRFVVIGCLLAIWPVLRMLPQLSAAEAVSPDATREIRVSGDAAAGGAGGVVVCAMPLTIRDGQAQVAIGRAAERDLLALRTGLFALCEGYRTGLIAAADYGSALADFPTLVLLIAARAGLKERAAPKATATAVVQLETTLSRNQALQTLCALPVFSAAGPYPPCVLVAAQGTGPGGDVAPAREALPQTKNQRR